MVKSKYGGFRSVARMCQGAAISRIDQQAAERMQRLPDFGVKQLAGDAEINQRRGDGKHHADQALEQQAGAQARRQQEGPPARARLRLIDRAQERPHGKRDARGEHHVGNQNARE